MDKIFICFRIIEASLMIIMIIGGSIGSYYGYTLLIHLKEKHVNRWAELVGAKFNGKECIGGWGTGFDGIKYVFSKKDDGFKEVFRLKLITRRCWFFIFIPMAIFVFNFFGVIIIWILNGCPKIQ